jgi:hypothetical protein
MGAVAVWAALTVPLALGKGEEPHVIFTSRDVRTARQILKFALGEARACAQIAPLIVSPAKTSFAIRRPHDGVTVNFECLPADGDALRGRTLVMYCGDEFAFLPDEEAATSDIEVVKATSPRVVPGGFFLLASTPYWRRGVIFDYSKDHGKGESAVVAWASTEVVNPSMKDQVRIEKKRDERNALREFGDGLTPPQFVDRDETQFFPAHLLKECAIDEVPEGQGEVACGVDLGFSSDGSGEVVVKEIDGTVYVSDVLEEKPPRGGSLIPSQVIGLFAARMHKFGVAACMADSHSREMAREHFAGHGIGLLDTPGGLAFNSESYLRVRNLLAEGKLKIPKRFEKLLAQMALTTSRPMASGLLQIINPRRRGSHSDALSALVLAVWVATSGSQGDPIVGGVVRFDPAYRSEEREDDWHATSDEYEEDDEPGTGVPVFRNRYDKESNSWLQD